MDVRGGTIEKAEHWRINAFDLWCWRRLLRVPWTARGSSRSTLREISPEYSLEGLMLKLKLQYFDHLMQRTDSLERQWWCERLKAGGEGVDRVWDGWMASLTQWTSVWVNSRSWWWTGRPGVLQSIGSQRAGRNWVTELNWAWPHPSEQASVSLSVSLSQQETSISFLFFSSGLRFVRTLHHDLSILGGPTQHGSHSFIELDKAVVHVIRSVSFLLLLFSVCLPSTGEE